MSDHRQAVLDAACHFLLQSPPGEREPIPLLLASFFAGTHQAPGAGPVAH